MLAQCFRWSNEFGTWKEERSRQRRLVEDLVDYAIAAPDMARSEGRRHWVSVSTEVCTVFELSRSISQQHPILIEMALLYRQNILPIWPMICEAGLDDPTSMHPVFFLVAVSIGAMYLDKNASVFGTLMHERLRTALLTGFIEEEATDTTRSGWHRPGTPSRLSLSTSQDPRN